MFYPTVFNVMLGLSLPNGYSISATWTRFVLCGYIAFYVIIFATLEVIACTCEQKGKEANFFAFYTRLYLTKKTPLLLRLLLLGSVIH